MVFLKNESWNCRAKCNLMTWIIYSFFHQEVFPRIRIGYKLQLKVKWSVIDHSHHGLNVVKSYVHRYFPPSMAVISIHRSMKVIFVYFLLNWAFSSAVRSSFSMILTASWRTNEKKTSVTQIVIITYRPAYLIILK